MPSNRQRRLGVGPAVLEKYIFLNNFFFPWNISIPTGLQPSRCQQRLCVGPAELEKKEKNLKKLFLFLFFFPWNNSILAGLQHSHRQRRLYYGLARIEMCKEFFDLEFWVTDFTFNNLVSSWYLGFEVLNILVLVFRWMQWYFHLSIEIFGRLAMSNAHFKPGNFVQVPSCMAWLWARLTWNVPRVFWFWVVIDFIYTKV
jgi:hypothetical protein